MITITVQRHRIHGRIFGENIIEDRKEPMDQYKEEKTDIGVADKSEFKREFIEEIAKKVTSQNQAEERKFKKKKSGTFLRLTIVNIK